MFCFIEKLERELVTPPLNGLILPGITRDSVLHLGRQWGEYKISERTITMDEVCKLIKDGRVSITSKINENHTENFYNVFY